MATATSIQQLNRDLADKLVEEAKLDLPSWPLGKFVGIANGHVIVVSDDLDEIVSQLERAEPDPSRTFVVEPGRDYTKVCEIWRIS
ncbi:MAG: hypothetical protein EXR98_07090 [Gemmataceae bacterium]|nr:hypothetical protein [Gemmataceae bacterium]